ncbi:TolC family protein [Cetobacterium sp.]|uniref:TolC family protein n=1 Tax=Cetobacterium sp. TaxID=2071632 RepID=UPI003AF0B7C3
MRKGSLLMGILVLSLGAYSQELGLEEILKRVETNNPEIRVKELDVKIKEKGKKKAFRNLILPPVTIESENDWETAKNEGFGFEKIEATIPLFQGGKMMNTYKKSKSELELSKAEKILAVYSWQEAGVDAYFSTLNYKKQREITDLTIAALQKQRNRLSGLYKENKMIAKSEVLKVEADLENNRALNFENAQKERASKEVLMQLLGYDLDRQVTLEEFNTVNYLNSLGDIKKVKNPKDTTLGKKESLMVDLAEYDLKITKADLYPVVYIKPSHRFKEENLDTNKYETVNEGRVELGITYTFAWGATLDSVDQSEYKLDQARIMYDNNIQGIELDMRNKLGEIESLAGQSEAQKKRLELLRENLKIDNLRYDNELVTTFDYLNSVNQLRTAEEDYYKLQRTLVLAVIEYENLYK